MKKSDQNKIIAIVDSYISLCTLLVTNDYNDYHKHIFVYRQRWETLMSHANVLNIPLWIQHSPNVAHAHAAINSHVEGGTGSWERRRNFLQKIRADILSSVNLQDVETSFISQEDSLDKYHDVFKTDITGLSNNGTKVLKKREPIRIKVPSTTIANTVSGNNAVTNQNFQTQGTPIKKKVFIVHGHDDSLKFQVYQFLIEEEFEPVILHLQANDGDTIIEKLERHFTDISYAIVLYTACDEGRSVKETGFRSRARQNVVFEHGYLLSKLGRENVSALVSDGVETPGDMSGVVYIQESSDWRYSLLRELKKLKK